MGGSTVKRGKVWYIRYDLPPGPDGKRREKMESCPGMSEPKAKTHLARRLADISRNVYVESNDITFGDHLRRWLDYNEDGRHSPATTARYNSLTNHHIIPVLGNIPLVKLRAIEIQDLLSSLSKNGKVGKTGGLAPKTIKLIHGLIHASLVQAVRWDLVSKNVADYIDTGRVMRKPMRTAADPADFHKILDAIVGSPYRIPVLIAMGTGLRVAEVVGLKWSDYDQKRRRLIVRRSICQLPGQLIEKETKTGMDRIVRLPQSLMDELDSIKPADDADGWVCVHPDGRMITPNMVSQGFIHIAKKAGVNIRFHGLRHTQATALYAAGVSSKVISERLGHSTVSITEDIYTHVLPDKQDEAADIIDQLFTSNKPRIRVVEQTEK